MTSASRGPDYPLDANRRRIELTRGITAPSVSAQGGDWTWIVWLHPDDPLRADRLAAFESAGHEVIPVVEDAAPAIDWDGPVLTTRIDDDDAFAVGAFDRLRAAADGLRRRTALMFPIGYRVHEGRVDVVRHGRNAWLSVFAPAGDRSHAKSVQHQRIRQLAPVRWIDMEPAWLWTRHPDTDKGSHLRASEPVTRAVRSLFAIDWSLVGVQ